MACGCYLPTSLAALRSSHVPRLHSNNRSLKCSTSIRRSRVVGLYSATPVASPHSAAPVAGFGWDDVVREMERKDDDPSDLSGYFQRVRTCNRGSELQPHFIPFTIENEVVGCIHERFCDHLIKFQDVFTLLDKASYADGPHVGLHLSLKTPDARTSAVGDVIKCLGDIIPGIRNELYPVTSSFGKQVFFSLERAAAPYFGIKAYGVHMNGYVVKGGKTFLWVGKRSALKPTYPGMLDHLVAGGLPFGISCKNNLMKECDEEAGIPCFIAEKAISVGAVSYMDIEGCRFKRDVLFCYDLELPLDFVPKNEDGEVNSFKLIPIADVAKLIRRTEFFKPNCSLVIIDFLFRHGFISPDHFGYLQLLHKLRSGNCS